MSYLEKVRAVIADKEKKPLRDVTPYAIAKYLHVTPEAVYQMFRERSFSDDSALIVAELLGEPVMRVIAAANVDRAKRPDMRAKWDKLRRSS